MLREKFVTRFNEEDAKAIEAAANMHENGVHNNPGSDPFRWAICICIGFECMSKDSYREYHGIKSPWTEIHQWIKDEANLSEHDGDVDYLGAMAGAYNEYMPSKES
jgi:hypothetical protein